MFSRPILSRRILLCALLWLAVEPLISASVEPRISVKDAESHNESVKKQKKVKQKQKKTKRSIKNHLIGNWYYYAVGGLVVVAYYYRTSIDRRLVDFLYPSTDLGALLSVQFNMFNVEDWKTDRLMMRKATLADKNALLVALKDPATKKYFWTGGKEASDQDCEQYADTVCGGKKELCWVITLADKAIGLIGLNDDSLTPSTFILLAPGSRGNHYAQEAFRWLLRSGFRAGCTTIQSDVYVNNVSSKKLMQSVGMVKLRTHTDPNAEEGLRESITYSIHKDHWASGKAKEKKV